jgi:hypothetical protein
MFYLVHAALRSLPLGEGAERSEADEGDTNRPLISRHRTMHELSPGIACLKISIFLKQVRYRAGLGKNDIVCTMHELSAATRRIHNLFTGIPIFPLAFSCLVGYYVLALKGNEC